MEENFIDNNTIRNPSMGSSNVTTDTLDVYTYAIAFGYVYVQTTICIIGFALNLLNFSVFLRAKFAAPTYIIMTFLSLADAVTLGLRIPQGYIFLPQLMNQSSDGAIYVYVYNLYVETPATNMSETINAWLTMVLAIERYVSMKHWHVAKRYFTPSQTRKLVGILFLVAVTFNLPYFALQSVAVTRINGTLELYSRMTGFSQSHYYAGFSWLRLILVQIIPLCFLCVSNCMLFVLVSQHNQKLRESRQSSPTCCIPSHRDQSHEIQACEKVGIRQRFTHEEQHTYAELVDQFQCISGITNGSPTTTTDVVKRVGHFNDRNPIQVTLKAFIRRAQPTTHRQCRRKLSRSQSCSLTIACDRAQRRRSIQNKLTILLIAVILLFLAGQIPQALAYLRVFTTLGICSFDGVEYCIAHSLYRMVSVNLAQLAFASTFFVYLSLNRDFRITLAQMMCATCSKLSVPRFATSRERSS